MYKASELIDLINSHLSGLSFDRFPKELYAPIEYVLSMGGKRIRPVLMMLAYNLYQADVTKILNQATGIEVYHNYTLLHDDLMDRADMRRGKATVHKVWDANIAILSGDAMLVLAEQMMADCESIHYKEIINLFNLTALEICEGQQMDMNFEQRNDVSENEYIEMIRLKTAVLLSTALKIGALLGNASCEDAGNLYQFGINIGLAFQLQDDLLDVYGDSSIFGKNIGGDILCNKKTYLLIKALNIASDTEKEELNGWLEAKSCQPQEKISGVTSLFNRLGVRDFCEKKMQNYYTEAFTYINKVGVAEELKCELKGFVEHLIGRVS
ncbi:MAG: polyprenyl synthetase family protein [Bacteroidaceae bacterium]|nr:polyprenyl synthetase family protein [Bacteroidaceae bacterium]